MQLRAFLPILSVATVLALLPANAMAQSDAEDVVEHLAADGFEVLDMRRTLLGRLRFRRGAATSCARSS